jgi:DNA-binding response OmpR family regulator
MRILIADDDLTSRVILAAALNKDGHEVIEAADGAEAWAIMRNPAAPALAILDWLMPNMDGLEVIRRVRTLQSPLPPYLIILTTRDRKADLVFGLGSGANDFLAKPFDPGELLARVEVGRRMIEMQEQLALKVQALSQALEHIRTLQGILPICMYCKKICDGEGYWNQIEAYVSRHSDATFSHGICPDCLRTHAAGLQKGARRWTASR